jgi:hypothetical protein
VIAARSDGAHRPVDRDDECARAGIGGRELRVGGCGGEGTLVRGVGSRRRPRRAREAPAS